LCLDFLLVSGSAAVADLLLSEQQMPREEAVTGEAVPTVVSHQPDFVSLHKLDEGAAAGCDVALLAGGE